MERAHFAVVAIAVAVAALLGMRIVSSSEPAPHDHFGSDVVPGMVGADGTRVRRLAMEGDDRGGPAGGRKAPGQPDAPRDKRRRGAGGGAGALGDAQVIGGSARARNVVGSGSGGGRGARGGDATDDGDLLPGTLGARLPGAPQPRGGRDLNPPDNGPSRQTFDFVDEDPQPDANAPLMSIPFKGAIDAENGDTPIEATGLVVDDDGVQFPDDARLSFPSGGRVDGEAGSISFEIEPTWAGSDNTDQSMVQIRNEHVWENTLQIVKNINALRFIIIDEGGVERNVNIFIDDWQPGEAHEVTATWGEAQMSLYVDGNLVGQNTMPNDLSFPPTTPIHIGSDFAGTSYHGAGGTIRDFQIYGRALSIDEVTRQ